MKTIMKKPLLLLFMITLSLGLFAQVPPPPPEGGHGQSGNQEPGGGAPIGSGLGILLALGAAYGGRKVYKAFQKQENLEE